MNLNVVEVILEDFKVYWARATEAASKSKAEKSADLKIGHHSHLDHQRKRLFFLRFLASSSSLF